MIKFSRIELKEDLMIVGIGDASFKSDDKVVGGVILFLTYSSMTRASPLYWKAKTISWVCSSSKDTETLNMATMMEDAIYTARQVEILIFGNYRRRIKIRLFNDSEVTLESIASSKQIERKTLRVKVVDLKERFIDRKIYFYSLLQTKNMWADVMNKEMKIPPALEDVTMNNVMDLPKLLVNEVKAIRTEICMNNIRNR